MGLYLKTIQNLLVQLLNVRYIMPLERTALDHSFKDTKPELLLFLILTDPLNKLSISTSDPWDPLLGSQKYCACSGGAPDTD